MSTDMVNTILAMSIHPYVFIHTAIVMRPKRLRTADPENHAVHCGTGPGSIAEAYTAHLTDKLSEVFLWQFLISSIAQGVCAHIGPIPGAPTHPPTHPVVVMTRGHWHCVCYVTNLPLLQVQHIGHRETCTHELTPSPSPGDHPYTPGEQNKLSKYNATGY